MFKQYINHKSYSASLTQFKWVPRYKRWLKSFFENVIWKDLQTHKNFAEDEWCQLIIRPERKYSLKTKVTGQQVKLLTILNGSLIDRLKGAVWWVEWQTNSSVEYIFWMGLSLAGVLVYVKSLLFEDFFLQNFHQIKTQSVMLINEPFYFSGRLEVTKSSCKF